MRGALEGALGADNVLSAEPITASEDFSVFVEQGIPGFYLSLGGADPQSSPRRSSRARTCPRITRRCSRRMSDPALHTAISAELAMLRELLRADAAPPARH